MGLADYHSNGTFWIPGQFIQVAMNLLGLRDPAELAHRLAKKDSSAWRELKRLNKLEIKATYRGCPTPDQTWVIHKMLPQNAREYQFEMRTSTGTTEKVNLVQYFQKKYNVNIQFWNLPVVQMTRKKVVYPMELIHVEGNQRYNYKLDENQTAGMIKFAVTLPSKRMESVKHGLQMLNWPADPVLSQYGLKVDTNMVKTKARVLPNPHIQFANGTTDPKTSGRWDLKGKKFFAKNAKPLKSWGVCVFSPDRGRGSISKEKVDEFISNFVRIYRTHGGEVEATQPLVIKGTADPGDSVQNLWNSTGNHFKLRPQMLVFCVPDRNSFFYLRLKKSCDCRYGVVSQVMQNQQVSSHHRSVKHFLELTSCRLRRETRSTSQMSA